MPTDITVSLVSQNQRSHLERLLPSLYTAVGSIASQILLVVHQSDDNTADVIRNGHPLVQVYENRQKTGYGENQNKNLERARGRYFVAMNSDMLVSADTFTSLLDFMERNPDVGIVAPKILNEDGSIQGLNKRYPTLIDLFLRRFLPKAFQRVFQSRIDYYEMRDIGYDRIYDVPFLSGAFMFCRTDLLRLLHGFDPRYFLYFEDVDLCRRVQRTHRTVFYPYVSVIHFWERSAHKSWIYTYYFIKSAFRYFSRWGYRLY